MTEEAKREEARISDAACRSLKAMAAALFCPSTSASRLSCSI